MREKVKIEMEDRRIRVHLRRNDWDEATETIASWRALPPEGYKLVKGDVRTRGQSGAACNVELLFVHCDSRVDEFTEQEAYDFLRMSTEVGTKDFDADALLSG